MIHHMHLEQIDFEKVRSGSKTLELRLYNKKRGAISLGDTISFAARGLDGEDVSCKVVSIHKAANFKDLFGIHLNPAQAGFQSLEELIKAVRRFYSEADEEKSGVICFGLAMIAAGE